MSSVDVIIPCYKYGHFLRDCVISVLGQRGVELRVTIIDDASPDNTEQIGKQLAAEDRRITFYRHRENLGHIGTYNEGLARATSKYTLLLSADDLLTPDSLMRSVRLMDAYPEVGFTFGRAIKTRNPNEIGYDAPQDYIYKVIPGREYLHSVCSAGAHVIDTPTVVVRTAIQHKVGGYRKELPHAADMEMWLRFSLFGSVGYIDACQALYRLHDSNMSVFYNNIRDFRQRKLVFDSLFDFYPNCFKGEQKLRRLANQGLAENAFWMGSKAFEHGAVKDCKRYLDFALETHRSLRYSPTWWRLQLKMRLGTKLWSSLRPLARFLRGQPVSPLTEAGANKSTGPCW